jgi:DNA-binding GntR family transcriptional regulator
MLEGMAARTCAEKGGAETAALLAKALERIRKAYADGSPGSKLVASTTVFYERLFLAADRPVAWTIVCALNGRINHLRAMTTQAPGRGRDGPKAMEAIVEAIRSGNADAAAQACMDHMKEASALARDFLENGRQGRFND